jgi:hypothetical protein
MVDEDAIEVFVIDEAPVTADPAADAVTEEEPGTGFAVHLPDQPPEEGGPVWIVEDPSPEERAALQEALDEGLVTEVPGHLLDGEPATLDDTNAERRE